MCQISKTINVMINDDNRNITLSYGVFLLLATLDKKKKKETLAHEKSWCA